MARNASKNTTSWSIWLTVILTSLAGVMATYFLFVEAPPPRHFVMATGSEEGAYHRFAERYRDLLAKDGITLEIRITNGSVENLELLKEESSDVLVGFVQSGIVDPATSESLEALGSLYREPLWIFYRSEKVVDRLTQLRGQRIAVGPEGSGTRVVALQLLKANGLEVQEDDFSNLGGNAAATALETGEIDAAFFIAGIEAAYIGRLLKNPEIHLVELVQSEAYERQFRYLSAVRIVEGLLDLKQNIPSKEMNLIAPAATLIAHKSLHPALVSQLLKAASKIHHHGDLLSAAGEFPSSKLIDLPLNADAERYFRVGLPVLHRYLPFWLATLLDRMKIMAIPLVMLFMPLLRMAPPLVRWQTRRKIYTWYAELRKIDQHSINGMSPEEAIQAQASLAKLELQISQVGVPLSYMQEYYNLRMHLNLVRSRVTSSLLSKP